MKRKIKSVPKDSGKGTKSLSASAAPDAAASKIHAKRDYVLLGTALVLATVLAFIGLTNHMLWDDEANTALFGRSFLKTGTLTGVDGANIIGYREGAELDENLINTYTPPLQYWVAAAGMRLFGETTFGARFLFVAAGLLALIPLFFWVRWHFSGSLLPWLPVLLVAASPAYLLYIRQCRYYPLAMLFTALLLALYSYPKSSLRSTVLTAISGAFMAILLMFTNYLNAVAIAGVLPLFLMLHRYRNKQQIIFLSAVFGAFLCSGIYVLITANPLLHDVAVKGEIVGIARYGILLWWHITGLGSFEFFPLLVPFILLTCFALRLFKEVRTLAGEGLLIVVGMIIYIGVTVTFSPQPVFRASLHADMRYGVPLILIGSVVTACAVYALWQCGRSLSRVLAVGLTLLVVTTNVAALGFIGGQPLTSTIYNYVRENLNHYTTGPESLVMYIRKLPPGKAVQVLPPNMVYPAMFYAPGMHYCCQLDPDKAIRNDLVGRLPDYAFTGRTRPDYIFIGTVRSVAEIQALADRQYGTGVYKVKEVLSGHYRDFSRPEIPHHKFESSIGPGFIVLEKAT